MDLDRFKSHRTGRLKEIWYEDKKHFAFVPKPLPSEIKLDRILISALSDADRAIGQLSGLSNAAGLTNIRVLIGPFLRREAVYSSRIEGTQTDIDELYSYETKQLGTPGADSRATEADAQEVENYVSALEYGIARIESTKVDLALIRELHSVLMKEVQQGRARPGEFRRIQNWISRGGRGISGTRFVPPPVDEMNSALEDLEGYIQTARDLPPLIRLALIHYQFEAIHPFVDGNGRIGRMLISLLLVKWNLLPSPILNLSAFIERERDRYYELLLAVSELGQWEEWVLYFLQCIKEGAEDASRRLKLLQDLKLGWSIKLRETGASETARRLIEELFTTPKITIPVAQKRLGVSDYKTAQRAVERLVNLDILIADSSRYGRQFVAHEIMRIISD